MNVINAVNENRLMVESIKIEDLIKSYKEKCNLLCSIGEITCRAKVEIYYNVILDLEKIL